MKDEIRKEVEIEVESITEMFESARVRGDGFYRLAVASFEGAQVVELLATISAGQIVDDDGSVDEEAKELNEVLANSATSILHSLLNKVAPELSQEEHKEAFDFGMKVYDRKVSLQDRLSAQLGG